MGVSKCRRRVVWGLGVALAWAATSAGPATAERAHEKAADVLQIGIPTAALGVAAWHRDLEGVKGLALSGLASQGATWALKVTIDKQRPSGAGWGFPSGHTSAAAWGAGFLHRRYGLRWAWPAYLGTAFVGWSRVDSNDHYVEDVIAGAGIGLLAGWFLTHRYEDPPIQVIPASDGETIGLLVSGSW